MQKNLSKNNLGIKIIKRCIFKLDVVKHAVIMIEKRLKKVTSIISLQANSPEVKLRHEEYD